MQYGLGMLHANENIFYLPASTESFLNSLKSFMSARAALRARALSNMYDYLWQTDSLVTLFYLSLSVYCELLILFLDFLNDLFHDVISLLVKH